MCQFKTCFQDLLKFSSEKFSVLQAYLKDKVADGAPSCKYVSYNIWDILVIESDPLFDMKL